MFNKSFRIILLGAPASGKGTISRRIRDRWACEHIAPGDILRQNVQNRSKLGVKVEQFMKNGQLVPDELVIDCLKDHLCQFHNKSLLFDGFPRTIAQANKLLAFVENGKSGQLFETVINIVVPHDVIVERAKGRWIHLPSGRIYNTGFKDPKVPGLDDVTGEKLVQRDDDKPQVVRKRLQLYEELIKPVIEFYQSKNLLKTYEGKTTAEIWPRIERFLEENINTPIKT